MLLCTTLYVFKETKKKNIYLYCSNESILALKITLLEKKQFKQTRSTAGWASCTIPSSPFNLGPFLMSNRETLISRRVINLQIIAARRLQTTWKVSCHLIAILYSALVFLYPIFFKVWAVPTDHASIHTNTFRTCFKKKIESISTNP